MEERALNAVPCRFDACHQSLVWLPFDPGHRLMRQFVCDHGMERAFVLHGPERVAERGLGPIHEINEGERLALTHPITTLSSHSTSCPRRSRHGHTGASGLGNHPAQFSPAEFLFVFEDRNDAVEQRALCL